MLKLHPEHTKNLTCSISECFTLKKQRTPKLTYECSSVMLQSCVFEYTCLILFWTLFVYIDFFSVLNFSL